MNLTPQQSEFISAVETASESLALRALAGTGKTTTLVEATKVLRPEHLPALAIAFNKKTAEELTARMPPSVVCMTLNSLGHRAWTSYQRSRPAVDAQKMGKIITPILRELGLDKDEDAWGHVLQLTRWAKQCALAPAGAMGDPKSLVPDEQAVWEQACSDEEVPATADYIQAARLALIESIRQAWVRPSVIDFDDQLYLPIIYGVSFPKYKTVIIDEAQDLNSIQHEIVARTVDRYSKGRVVIAGDPNQSIYGFRGARPDSMSELIHRFQAKVFPLTITFRCPKRIVRLASRLVPEYEAAPEAPEGEFQRLASWSHTTFQAGDAILCRNNGPLIRTAFYLLKNGVTCFMLGRDIGKGLISTIKRALGNSSREALLSISREAVAAAIEQWYVQECAVAASKMDNAKLERLADRKECLDAILETSGASTAQELIVATQDLFSKDRGRVILSTIHRAKGLEWPRVFLLDPWRMPSRWAKAAGEGSNLWQQEMNCLYVAQTRAKLSLFYINLNDRETVSS